jgi:hypothetical protein
MAKPEDVTVTVDSHSESGVELLPDVLRQLSAMTKLLTEFAKDPKYSKVEVVDLQKHSPLIARLRVVTIKERPKIPGQSPRKPSVHATGEPFRKLERMVSLIKNPSKIKGNDANGLVTLSDVAKQLRQDVATIETSKSKVIIGKSIIEEIDDALGQKYKSRGSITGILESINVHTKPWSFTIYPEIGPNRVRCTFGEELFSHVHQGLKKIVTVNGMKDYVARSPWPVRIDVDDIDILEVAPDGAWLNLANDLSRLWDDSDDDLKAMFAEEAAA